MHAKSFLFVACALVVILWREPAWHSCPRGCSGHGQCLQGVCFCEPRYGGPDCGADSLQLAGPQWATETDFDLNISDRCSFLSLADVAFRDDGGGNGSGVVFYGEGGKHMYHVPADMVESLPDTCATPRSAGPAARFRGPSLRPGLHNCLKPPPSAFPPTPFPHFDS
mmetsp:Transcript_18873/g.52649  ORF Transcript_18873/g.52649 Transcript_18873/m.52649 type:complete len:167 (-) Transcript_18873:84-584(-)